MELQETTKVISNEQLNQEMREILSKLLARLEDDSIYVTDYNLQLAVPGYSGGPSGNYFTISWARKDGKPDEWD
jgi:hypothetical protein